MGRTGKGGRGPTPSGEVVAKLPKGQDVELHVVSYGVNGQRLLVFRDYSLVVEAYTANGVVIPADLLNDLALTLKKLGKA